MFDNNSVENDMLIVFGNIVFILSSNIWYLSILYIDIIFDNRNFVVITYKLISSTLKNFYYN